MIPGVQKSQVTFSFLHAYMAILLKHSRLTLLLCSLSASIGLFYYVYAKPLYQSTALIQVKKLSNPSDDTVDYTDESMYYTLQKQIESDHILERTARKLGIRGRQGSIKSRACKEVRAKYNSESNLEISFVTYEYPLSLRWPDAMYDAFEEYRREARLQQRERQIESWRFDRNQVETKLAEKEAERKQLIDERKQWELRMGMAELERVPSELIALKETLKLFSEVDLALKGPDMNREKRLALMQRAEKEAKVEIGEIVPGLAKQNQTEIYPQEGSKVILMPEMVRKSKEGWEVLYDDLQDLEEELAARLKVYREAHPEIIKLRQQVADVEARLDKDVMSMQNRFYAELENLKTKRVELEEKLKRFKALSIKMVEFATRLRRIDTSMEPWEKLLHKLNRDLDRFDINKDRELFMLLPPTIISESRQPIVPTLKKTAMLILGLSVVLGLGIPFLLEYLDNTYSVIEEAEKDLGLLNLGIVPRVSVPEEDAKIVPGNPPRIVQETFRMIRTNLVTKSEVDEKRQVIMVSSSLPREGKSMFSLNLAESFANLGERTLLIDLDLRRGKLNRALNIPRDPGLTDMLMNTQNNALTYCLPTHNELLSFLPSGQRIENVTEVLASAAFSEFMTRVRSQYERIIVDTPPVLGLAETTGVLPLVDGVVMVVWSGYTPSEQVKSAVNQLKNNGANFFGFVLNQLDLKCPTNYFRYYYFSDYYYTSYK